MPRPSRYRETELGTEARCSKCGEWWPADKEFFYFSARGTPHSWCKACYMADRARRRPNQYGKRHAHNDHARA